MQEIARTLSEKEAELARLAAELAERSHLSDSQRVEIVALRTQGEALKAQVERSERDIGEAQERLVRERQDAADLARELEDQRGKSANLTGRIGELERQLTVQTTEAEVLNRRVGDLETRLQEQGKVLAERDRETAQLRAAVEAAQGVERDLRAERAALEQRHDGMSSSLRAEKAALEKELEHAREERARLVNDLNSMKHDAESAWGTESGENALLRERINDIAAEVARLTLVLEGPGSKIEAMLGGEVQVDGSVLDDVRRDAATSGGASLADRIRALQARASRAPATTP
jgi:chromosome segregation ATPase